MDRIFRTAFLLLPAIFTISCTSGTRTIENPLIDTASTFTLDISKVEISDSATVLYINADYIPHYWIRISSDTYLAAKDKKYPMTGTDGIQADSLFWMPDSGKASFRLMFRPLPRNVKSFDFIESDSEDSFRLYGVDLTGKIATQITTSKHFYDVTAHRFVEETCFDLGMRVVRGLSADMEDLLSQKGQEEARMFFQQLLFTCAHGGFLPPPPARLGRSAGPPPGRPGSPPPGGPGNRRPPGGPAPPAAGEESYRAGRGR